MTVLLTDGVNNRGADPVEASLQLARRGIKVYAVGIGTSGSGQLIPGTGEFADLDEDTLRAIAANTGGAYAPARDAEGLRRTFTHLARETVWKKQSVDGSLPLALGGGAVLALTLLAGLALGRFP